MKKFMGMFLAILMLISVLGAPVYAATTDYAVGGSNFTSENFTISDGVATSSARGAIAKWDINYEGEAYVKLSLKKGSHVSVVITASGIPYTRDFTAAADNTYDFGCYTFTAGDSVSVIDAGGKTVNFNNVQVTSSELRSNGEHNIDFATISGFDASGATAYEYDLTLSREPVDSNDVGSGTDQPENVTVGNFNKFPLNVDTQGGGSGWQRIVVYNDTFPFEVTANDELVGLYVNGTATDTIGTAGLTGLQLNTVTGTYLDTTMIDKDDVNVFSGWSSSSLKNYNGTPTYYSAIGVATWDIPSSVKGVSDIYYYFPENSSSTGPGAGYCDSSLTFELKDSEGNTTTWTYGGDKVSAGWQKVGYADFSEKTYTSITVSRGDSANARLTAFRFTENSNPYYSFLITPDNLLSQGGWQYKTYQLTNFTYMEGSGTSIEPAHGIYSIPNGTYYVYVLSADYAEYAPATRRFYFNINGSEFKKRSKAIGSDWKETLINKYTTYFGTHEYPGTGENDVSKATESWKWERGENPITITNETLDIKVICASANARFSEILISQDPFIYLDQDVMGYDDSDAELVANTATKFESLSAYESSIAFPESYNQSHTSVSGTATLSNDNTTVTFNLGTLPNGTTSVKRQVKVGDVEAVSFDDGLGFLALRADSVTNPLVEGYYPRFETGYKLGSDSYLVKSYNVFQSGQPEWLIPTTLQQVDSKTVKMTASGTLADITAIWTLEENDKEPKVTVTATTKSAGVYSFGFFNKANEVPKSSVGYILNPFRWLERRFPPEGYIIAEAFSTTNHTQMTYNQNAQGQEITLGVAVDESSIERQRWTHMAATQTKPNFAGEEWTLDYTSAQSQFGFSTTGNGGGVQPAVFAPLMGSETCTFAAGDTFEFSYRPLSTVSTSGKNKGWYDCYSHVVQDIRGVYGFRDNYYSSMTDTVFNVYNLLKDDYLSGWSDDMLAHYYTEDTYNVGNTDALVYLQNYLLTEDQDLLMNRTLPTMAYLLTRMSSGFSSQHTYGDLAEGPINKELTYSTAFANSSFEGAYLMSRGRMPVFRNIAKKRENGLTIESGGLNLNNPSQGYWYDRANGNTSLSTAISYADTYLENRALVAADNDVDEQTFINGSYYPNYQSQFELYEATGDDRYLEGAIESARRMLPTLRATDMPLSKEEMYTPNAELINQEYQWITRNAWFYKDKRYRRGAVIDTTQPLSNNYVVTGFEDDALVTDDTPYPFWVTSRVGMSLEQFSTCATHNASIYMSTWAGELLRLGYVANDQLMMDMARNSLVGRSESYPGYYTYNYYTTNGQKDFPIKGFDSNQIYFTHIPPYLAALQDYLFSNAWVKSDGKIDFPYVRSQGYVWFNTRQYGFESGNMYDEKNMWPWLKEGTITISGTDAKQIDWIAGRRAGRAAFALTNACDEDRTVTITFNEDLGITSGSTATIYDAAGNKTTGTVTNNQITVTVPASGILTIAVSGSGIKLPGYAETKFVDLNDGSDIDMEESALGLMYEGNTYTPSYNTTSLGYNGYSPEKGYDVKAYALSMDDSAYMGYIFVGGRSTDNSLTEKEQKVADGEDGITKSVLTWHYEGEDAVTTVTDTTFPFEFLIPVTDDPTKKISFNVETTFGNGEVKTLGKEYTIAPKTIEYVEDNFIKSDLGEDIALTAGTVNGGEFLVSIPISTNANALYGYVYTKGDYTYDTTKIGLYHTVDDTYVTGKADNTYQGVSGSQWYQKKSDFINDFVFEGTMGDKTYTVPIVSYGLTSSHDTFQFVVDVSNYDGEIATSNWDSSNWTDVKIIHKETGKALSGRSNFGMYSPFRIDFCRVDALAEAFPEYFYVGPKVTAETAQSAYAFGYNGPIPTSAGQETPDCNLVKAANMKFTYNGEDYIVPISGVRGSNTLYAKLSVDDFNAVTGQALTKSEFIAMADSSVLTNFRLTAKELNVGSFPTSTVFISPVTLNGGDRTTNTTGMSDTNQSQVTAIRGNTSALKYVFAVAKSGEYDVYALNWDNGTENNRGSIFKINGTSFDTRNQHDMYNTAKYTAGADRYLFWEPIGSVTLSEELNSIYMGEKNGGATGYTQFMGLAFVPKSAGYEMTPADAERLADMIFDHRIDPGTGLVSTLSIANSFTTKGIAYDKQKFTVTVNGTEYEVKAGVGQSAAEKYYDANGNIINSATVLDAIITAGFTRTNASGEVNAILVDGKNVYPDRTLLYNGMEITVIDGSKVTKENFAPVFRNSIVSTTGETSAPADGVGMNMSSDFRGTTAATSYTKLFPFAGAVSADTTTATDNNLVGCKVYGYLTPTGILTTSDVVNHSALVSAGITSIRGGDKVYFTGDPIVKIASGYNNIFTGADENGHSTIAISTNVNNLIAATAFDSSVGMHLPYIFRNQKTAPDNSGSYDGSEWFIANTSSTNDLYANKIKDGKWQLLTTGTAPCQITIVGENNEIKEILKDQVVTGVAPLTITLNEGEKAFVWKSSPYNGPTSIFTSGIFAMKPLCEVLTY